MILIQGYGEMNSRKIENPVLIRYFELTNDEFFVSNETAASGIKITNMSSNGTVGHAEAFAENPELDRAFESGLIESKRFRRKYNGIPL